MDFQEFKNKYEYKAVEVYPNTLPKKPFVSVCVQTYQHAPFIKECLEGVLMQKTDFSFEILLGEDASNDGAREICVEYAKKHPDKIRLFLHHRENNIAIDGAPTGRFNFMYNLYAAKGKYIALCEGDDYWTDPYKLQKQVDFLERNQKYSACFTNAKVVNEETGEQRSYISQSGNIVYNVNTIIQGGGGMFPTASLVFRNSIKNYPDFFLKCKSGDRALSLLLAEKGGFFLLNEETCVYRKQSGGVFSSIVDNKEKRKQIKLDNIQLLDAFNHYTEYKYDKQIKIATSHLAKTALLRDRSSLFHSNSRQIFRRLSFKDKISFLYHFGLCKK